MKDIGWTAWGLAFVISATVHLALLLGLREPTVGATEQPAGRPTIVLGGLASVLGGIEQLEADVHEATVQEIRPRTTTANEKSAPEQAIAVAPLATSRPSITATKTAIPVEAPTPISPAQPQTQPARQPKTRESAEQPAKDVTKRPKQRQRPQNARSTAGTGRQGNATVTDGGQRGRQGAAAANIQSYGAKVRARILANRPAATGTGIAVVSFGLSGSGSLNYAQLARSSGNVSLDRAALAAVRHSSPFPPPPGGATTSQLRFSISFSFR